MNVEVTLRRPVPLEARLAVEERTDGGLTLRRGDEVLAEAAPLALDLAVPGPISFAAAAAAAGRHPRFTDHPVPRCFVCGPARGEGDGLRIFPGPLPASEVWAAPWHPDRSLAKPTGELPPEIVWAALDCPGAFAVNEPPRGLALLGRLAATIEAPVRGGERYVVLAWPLARDGRKLLAGTAIYDEGGRLCARARATWILTTGS